MKRAKSFGFGTRDTHIRPRTPRLEYASPGKIAERTSTVVFAGDPLAVVSSSSTLLYTVTIPTATANRGCWT